MKYFNTLLVAFVTLIIVIIIIIKKSADNVDVEEAGTRFLKSLKIRR